MSDNRPIGVFDSGLGGLCALRALRALMPHEDLVYFGDTGRTPYGTRSEEKITQYAMGDVRLLLKHNVKAILAACGTVSAIALNDLKKTCPVPIFGIIDSAVEKAVQLTDGRIGVMGTGATVKSGVFEKRIKEVSKNIDVYSVACPLLVPIVENDLINTDITPNAIRHYMSYLDESKVDTVILGCTHFPLLKDRINELYPDIKLVDSGSEASDALCGYLQRGGMTNDGGKSGTIRYFVSDVPNNFDTCAKVFMGACCENIEKVDIDQEQ